MGKAMANKAPIKAAEALGGKDKLLDQVVDVLERGDESKEELKARLKGAANSKLLRLLAMGKAVKERFGSKAKLIDALVALENRAKDKDYRHKLETWPAARLLDRHDALAKRKKKAA
jgi:hypothetical protein